MLSSESRQQFQRWQVIYIAATQHLKAEEVSALVGVSAGTVHQSIHRYNHKGPDVLILQGRGGRRRELLSWDEEKELLQEAQAICPPIPSPPFFCIIVMSTQLVTS